MLKAVVYQMGDGIFTCYGASIKRNNSLKKPNEKPINEVRFYINEELTDSISVYKNINKKMCETFLNNFIKLVLMGVNPIDLSTISDKSNLKFDSESQFDFGDPIFDCETYESHDPFERRANRAFPNPRKKDYEEFFVDNTRNLNYRPINDNFEKIYDPKFENDNNHDIWERQDKFDRYPNLNPSNEPYPYVSNDDNSDLNLNRYKPPFANNKPKDKAKNFIHYYYYGVGGFSMGGSVINDLTEINADALAVMLNRNNKSTFANSKDTINIFKASRIDYLELKTTNNDEWCFIMLPAFLTKDFEEKGYMWFHYDEVEKKYIPFDTDEVSSCLTMQTNGVEYFVMAVCPKTPMKVLLARRNDNKFVIKN